MAEAKTIAINLPSEELSAFCQRHQVWRLALFGSVVNGTFDSESDVDVLVTFAPQARVGFRNIAVHAYFAVEWSIVWHTATVDVPQLIGQIQEILVQPGGRRVVDCGPERGAGYLA